MDAVSYVTGITPKFLGWLRVNKPVTYTRVVLEDIDRVLILWAGSRFAVQFDGLDSSDCPELASAEPGPAIVILTGDPERYGLAVPTKNG